MKVERTDSAGIEIVTISGDLGGVPRWAIADDRRLVSGDEPPFLGFIGEVHWLVDGGIVIEDAQIRVLHLFDAQGRHIRAVAANGDGPGEVRDVSTLSVGPRGLMYVFDMRLERTSVFDLADGLQATFPAPVQGVLGRVYDIWRLSNGRFLAYQLRYDPSGLTGPYPRKNEQLVALSVFEADGTLADGPVRFPGPYTADLEGGDARAPFSNRPFVSVGAAGIVHGSGQDYEISVRSTALDLIGVIRWPSMKEEIVESEVDSAKAVLEASGSPVATMLAESTMTPNLLPSPRPAIGRVVQDDRGRLWVSRFNPSLPSMETDSEWHVLNAQGRPVGRVVMPDRSRLVGVHGDHVLFVRADSLDLEHVHVARVQATVP